MEDLFLCTKEYQVMNNIELSDKPCKTILQWRDLGFYRKKRRKSFGHQDLTRKQLKCYKIHSLR